MSLKENLIEYLQKNRRITLDQLYLFCGSEHKKTSNAERRFRELMSPLHPSYNPHVKAERNAKGAIVAYYWNESLVMASGTVIDKPIDIIEFKSGYCCGSFKIFGEHALSCPSKVIKKEVSTLF